MLEAVKLPAGIANLATSLTDVDGDALTLGERKVTVKVSKEDTHAKELRNGQAGFCGDTSQQ